MPKARPASTIGVPISIVPDVAVATLTTSKSSQNIMMESDKGEESEAGAQQTELLLKQWDKNADVIEESQL